MVDYSIFRRDVENFINSSSFADGPIRRINLWMEVLGPVRKPVWFCFDGVPLHDACKVECRRFMALVWEIDGKSASRSVVEVARVCIPVNHISEYNVLSLLMWMEYDLRSELMWKIQKVHSRIW